MTTKPQNKENIPSTPTVGGFVQGSAGPSEQIENTDRDDKYVAGAQSKQQENEDAGASWYELKEDTTKDKAMEAMDAESDDLLPDSPGDLVDYELKALLDIEREIMSGDDDDDDMHGVSPSDNDPMQLDRPTPRFPPGLNIDQDHTPAPLFSGQGQRPVFRDPARYFIGDPLGDPYFDKDEEEGPGRGQGRKAHTGRVRFTEAVQTKAEWELGFDPIYGKYRVKVESNLRHCCTIYYPSRR